MQSKLILLLLLVCCSTSTALRCYTCRDCDEHSKVSEVEVCSVPDELQPESPGTSQSPSSASGSNPAQGLPVVNNSAGAAATVPAAPPAAVPATGPSVGAASNTDEDYDSDESESAPQTAAGTAPGAAAGAAVTGAGTTAGAAGTPATSNNVSEDEDEDDDYDDLRRRSAKSSRQLMIAPKAVCYIASLRNNKTVITDRGCSIIRNGNQSTACTALLDGWEVVGCHICESNNCNAPIHSTVIGQLSSGSCRARTPLKLALLGISIMYFLALA